MKVVNTTGYLIGAYCLQEINGEINQWGPGTQRVITCGHHSCGDSNIVSCNRVALPVELQEIAAPVCLVPSFKQWNMQEDGASCKSTWTTVIRAATE